MVICKRENFLPLPPVVFVGVSPCNLWYEQQQVSLPTAKASVHFDRDGFSQASEASFPPGPLDWIQADIARASPEITEPPPPFKP